MSWCRCIRQASHLLDDRFGVFRITHLFEDLLRTPSGWSEALYAVGSENAENTVGEAAVEEIANIFLGCCAFVGVDADADEFSADLDKVAVAEQTVLRSGVAWSEYTRNPAALGGGSDEHDRAITSPGFKPA